MLAALASSLALSSNEAHASLLLRVSACQCGHADIGPTQVSSSNKPSQGTGALYVDICYAAFSAHSAQLRKGHVRVGGAVISLISLCSEEW